MPMSLRDQAALRSGSDAASSGKEPTRENSQASSAASGADRGRPPSGDVAGGGKVVARLDSQGRLTTRPASGGRVTVGAMPSGKSSPDGNHQVPQTRISAERLISTPVADTEELERARARTAAKEAWMRETAAAGRAAAAAEAAAEAAGRPQPPAEASPMEAAPAPAAAAAGPAAASAAATSAPPAAMPPPPPVARAVTRTEPYVPEAEANANQEPVVPVDSEVSPQAAGTPEVSPKASGVSPTPTTDANTDHLDPTGGVPVVGATSEWPPLPTPATALRPIATSVKSTSTRKADRQTPTGNAPKLSSADPSLEPAASDTPSEALVWPPAAPAAASAIPRPQTLPATLEGKPAALSEKTLSGRQFPAAWSMHRAPGEPPRPGADSDTASSDGDAPPRPSAAYAPFHNSSGKSANAPSLRDVHDLISKSMSQAPPLSPSGAPPPAGTIAAPASAPADPSATATAEAPVEGPRSLQRMLSPLSRRSDAPASPFRTNCPPSPESHPYALAALPASISSIPELHTGSPSAHTPRVHTPMSAGRMGGGGGGAAPGHIKSHLSDPTLLAAMVSPSPGFPAPQEATSGALPPDLVHSLSDNPGKPQVQQSPPQDHNPSFERSFIVSLPSAPGSETDGTPPDGTAARSAPRDAVSPPAVAYSRAGAPSASYDSLFGSIPGMPMPPRTFNGPIAAAAANADTDTDGATTDRGGEVSFGLVLKQRDNTAAGRIGPVGDSEAVGVRPSLAPTWPPRQAL